METVKDEVAKTNDIQKTEEARSVEAYKMGRLTADDLKMMAVTKEQVTSDLHTTILRQGELKEDQINAVKTYNDHITKELKAHLEATTRVGDDMHPDKPCACGDDACFGVTAESFTIAIPSAPEIRSYLKVHALDMFANGLSGNITEQLQSVSLKEDNLI